MEIALYLARGNAALGKAARPAHNMAAKGRVLVICTGPTTKVRIQGSGLGQPQFTDDRRPESDWAGGQASPFRSLSKWWCCQREIIVACLLERTPPEAFPQQRKRGSHWTSRF